MKFTLPAVKYQRFEENRKKCLQLSDSLRIESKIAIGFILKGDQKQAEQRLGIAKKIHAALKKLLKTSPFLYSVGGVDIGTEEYVEARLLADYLEGKPLSSMEDLDVQHEAFVGGLCDMSGELLRYARKHPEEMKQIEEDLETLHQSCLQMIITRNSKIRNKLGDLERNFRKMEDMIFQWELQHGS